MATRFLTTVAIVMAAALLASCGGGGGGGSGGGNQTSTGTVVAADKQAGGNWLYGGPNAEIGMVASGVTKDAGYNLATGVAALTIRLK